MSTTNKSQHNYPMNLRVTEKLLLSPSDTSSLLVTHSACQIDSQQTHSFDDTHMDIGEQSTSEFTSASGEQRFGTFVWRPRKLIQSDSYSRALHTQQSTGDKRSYDINSHSTFRATTEEHHSQEDDSRNGTIKKRKSEVLHRECRRRFNAVRDLITESTEPRRGRR